MKKVVKIIGSIVIILIVLLVISPFLFKGKLEDLLKQTINNNVNAQVSWSSLDVSLFKSFPDATVIVNDFSIVNNAPFQGDTLAKGNQLQIEMGLTQLFKNAGDDPIKIDAITINQAAVDIRIDQDGHANYDIAKTSDSTATTGTSDPFVFDLNHYEITNSQISYTDEGTKTLFHLKKVNHEGTGDFSAVSGELDTYTSGLVTLDYDGVNYLDGHDLKLDAIFLMDLEAQKYTFKENTGYVNELPLKFDGFVQLIEEGTLMDLTFETPDSDFKNFLAVIPKAYRSNLDGVETSGDFRVSGFIKGNVTDTSIPELDITIVSTDASFKYPSLPKQMNNINIDINIVNDTGIADLTFIEINNLQFRIDDDRFTLQGALRNLTGNMLINLAMNGTMDLGNLEKVYPLNLENPLQGRLTADFTTRFDMDAINNQQYQNIKNTGMASLSNFSYKSPEFPNPIAISDAAIRFKPGTIDLDTFTATTGSTDIDATGSIENLIPFVMSKEDLKGRFVITSKVFDMNDFSVKEKSVSTGTSSNLETAEEVLKIPDFLDAQLSFNADKVIYDNLILSNTKGQLTIENEEATISQLNSGIFGGNAGITGNVTTRNGTPTFDMTLDLNSIDIDQSFKELEMMQGLAPIAKALQGALNTKVNLRGSLDNNLSPILNTISGNAFAEILTANITPEQMPLLNVLDNKLDFINLTNLNLDTLTTNLTFTDGTVQVQPFDFKIEGITVNVSGSHTFSNTMDYTLNLDVPARYLGNDVSGLLSKLTEAEKENLTIDLPVGLSGNFAAPSVNLNLKAATTALTNQIIEIQKQRAKDKVEDKLGDVLGGLLGGGNTQTTQDSTSTGTPQSNPESTNENVIKDVATGILGGLLKKKPKTTKKDSIN